MPLVFQMIVKCLSLEYVCYSLILLQESCPYIEITQLFIGFHYVLPGRVLFYDYINKSSEHVAGQEAPHTIAEGFNILHYFVL